jgi:hypothetical protein
VDLSVYLLDVVADFLGLAVCIFHSLSQELRALNLAVSGGFDGGLVRTVTRSR